MTTTYSGFELTDDTLFKAASFRNCNRLSDVTTSKLEKVNL